MGAVSGGSTRGIPLGRLLWVGPAAGVAAAVVNAVVYLLASAFGAMPSDVVVPGRGPITLGAVLVSSFVPALVAAVVLTLLGRFTRRPVRNFVVLGAVVFVVSLVPPFSGPGAPVPMVAALILMHVVAAVVITGVLTALAPERWGAL